MASIEDAISGFALSSTPIAVQQHVKFILTALRTHKCSLAGVQRARGNGHILALELRDRLQQIAGLQQKLIDFRRLAQSNGVNAEAVINALGGEPDFAQFGGPAATGPGTTPGEFPVLFELDVDTGEATGTVMPFCSTACRDASGGTSYSGFKRCATGISNVRSFGYEPHCEQCGKSIAGSQVPALL